MRRSKALTTLLSIALFGALAFAPSGCSNNSSTSSSPDVGFNASGYDPYPPEMPSGLEVQKADASGLKLGWTLNSETDLAGYKVYIYDPSPFCDNSYRCLNSAQLLPPTQDWFVYQEDMSEGFHYFKIIAVDNNGNQSFSQAPLEYSYENASNASTNDARGNGRMGEQRPSWTPIYDDPPKEQNEIDGEDGI